MSTEWFHEAREELRSIGDPTVVAEICRLAAIDLRIVVGSSSLDGRVSGSDSLMYRRCVWLRDLEVFESFEPDDADDEFSTMAWDYVLVYRKMTSDERIHYKRSQEGLVVIRVLANAALAQAYCAMSRPVSSTAGGREIYVVRGGETIFEGELVLPHESRERGGRSESVSETAESED